MSKFWYNYSLSFSLAYVFWYFLRPLFTRKYTVSSRRLSPPSRWAVSMATVRAAAQSANGGRAREFIPAKSLRGKSVLIAFPSLSVNVLDKQSICNVQFATGFGRDAETLGMLRAGGGRADAASGGSGASVVSAAAGGVLSSHIPPNTATAPGIVAPPHCCSEHHRADTTRTPASHSRVCCRP